MIKFLSTILAEKNLLNKCIIMVIGGVVVMNYTENEKKMTKIYFRIGTILLLCGLAILVIDYLMNFENQWLREVSATIYVFTFGGAFASFIAVSLRKQWEKNLAHIPNLTVDKQSIFTIRRAMFDTKAHFFGNYLFYSLNGEKLAEVKAQVPPDEKWLRHLLSLLFRFDRILDETYIIQTEKKTYQLRKPLGWNKPYILKDEKGTVLGGYKKTTKNVLRVEAVIANASGQVVGKIEQGISPEEIIARGNDGEKWLRIRIGGIPTEAMELFANTTGSIVDFFVDSEAEDERMKLIAIPIVCQQFFSQ